MRTAKTLIRLGGWPGWSESPLGTNAILLVLSWGGSNEQTKIMKGWMTLDSHNWATTWQNQQNDMCALRSLRSWHPYSLITVFAVRMKKPWVLSSPLIAQRRLWSDWVDAQADLSLPWAHMSFCWFCHASAWATTKQAPCVLSSPLSAQWRLWSDWDEAQADLHLPWVHVILLVLSCFSMPNNEAGTTIANLKQKDLLHSNKVSMN